MEIRNNCEFTIDSLVISLATNNNCFSICDPVRTIGSNQQSLSPGIFSRMDCGNGPIRVGSPGLLPAGATIGVWICGATTSHVKVEGYQLTGTLLATDTGWFFL